jgi:hypothetical protein
VVLDNIISNALKYTPTGGTVTIDAHRSVPNRSDASGRVTISIYDTGPGVPSAFRDRIFDKFFRLEHQQLDHRSHARGAGIGLYMCRQIVELHGGRIACTAGANDRGARITVDLPVSGPVSAPEMREYVQPLKPNGLHGEEVHGDHTLTVYADKLPPRHPAARTDRSNASLAQPGRHRRGGDADAEAFQLATMRW